jgi:hypothetical protein
MLGEIYRWISRAGLLCLAVGGFVPLAAPPKNRPTGGPIAYSALCIVCGYLHKFLQGTIELPYCLSILCLLGGHECVTHWIQGA